jgi:hypothetical protein
MSRAHSQTRTTRALVGRKAQAMEAVRFRRRRRSAAGMPWRVASYSAIAIVRRIPHHEIQKRDF